MRRYGTLLLVLVLATASLLAAAAYNSATVTNTASLTIVSTNKALLSLEPNPGAGNKDRTAFINENTGQLVFGFGGGYGGTPSRWWGLQPGSVYVWEGLFKVTNNTGEVVHWVVEVDEALRHYVHVSSGDGPRWNYATPERALGPGDSEWVDVKVEIPADYREQFGQSQGHVVVRATAE